MSDDRLPPCQLIAEEAARAALVTRALVGPREDAK